MVFPWYPFMEFRVWIDTTGQLLCPEAFAASSFFRSSFPLGWHDPTFHASMPGSKIRPSKFSAAKKKVSRKQRAAVSNQKHLKKGIACSKDWKAPPQSLLLANFKQDWTFADVATWSDLKAWKIDPKKGFSFFVPNQTKHKPSCRRRRCCERRAVYRLQERNWHASNAVTLWFLLHLRPEVQA